MNSLRSPMGGLSRYWLLLLLAPLIFLRAAPLPVSALYEDPVFDLTRVSLDGRQVAMLVILDGEQHLALLDTTTMQMKLAAKLTHTELLGMAWKADDFLLMVMRDSDGHGEFRSFDLKTGKIESLSANRIKFRSARILNLLPDDPRHLILDIFSGAGTYLAKMDVRNGNLETLENSDNRVVQWFVDLKGAPVAAYCDDNTDRSIRWRPDPSSPWRQIELAPSSWSSRLEPFEIYPDQKRLLAWDRSGAGTTAVVALDPGTLAKETIFQHPEVDAEEAYFWNENFVAVGYEDDRPRLQFLNPEHEKLQKIVDASLPATVNRVVSTSRDLNVLTIESESDRDSGIYYLLNLSARKLVQIGTKYRSRDPASMGTSRAFSFPSKDQLKIHGRLLLPPGNPPKPPVLLVLRYLSGPRSRMAFDRELQSYASRGYAVAVIDYRGCGGYGKAFSQAGNYQFATGMVEDIKAGLDYLVSQGWVDGERIGLVTHGYGGVVGLQALVRLDRFKIWLNYDTSLYENPMNQERLVFSERKPAEIVADLGGKAAVKAMVESLNPGPLLPQVKVPSFHLNEYDYLNTPFIKKNIGTPPDRLVVMNVSNKKTTKPEYAESQAAREAMLAFLAKWLPATTSSP